MKNLVIVESATKSKTISKYLNSNPKLKHLGEFTVTASFGHIRDLEKKNLSIDIEKNFKPIYSILTDKLKIVKELVSKAKEHDVVWLATDADYEGEAIAMHLRDVLKLKNYKRITFTEITSKALEHAVLNPRELDERKISAQETRRILDRLVGFKLSPILWKVYKTSTISGLSAGRVQSSLMHIILQKEFEILNFKSTNYWHYLGNFKFDICNETQTLKEVDLYSADTKKILKLNNKDEVVSFLKNIQNQYTISNVIQKETKKKPDSPFITSSLQQDAFNKFGFSPKRTMQLAQELYEKGYITYMRTDSYNISNDFAEKAIEYIEKEYGENYVERIPKSKSANKSAQQAHECIRPTSTDLLPNLENDTKKLYNLIWNRTIAYFMKPCIYDELELYFHDLSFKDDAYFISVFSKVKFNGYLALLNIKNENYDYSKYIDSINKGKYKINNINIIARNTWTTPPVHFNESTIVKTMEKEGIGRPSTYVSIIGKLFEKNYVIKSDIKGEEKVAVDYIFDNRTIDESKRKVTVGEEKNKIIPTNIGKEIDKFLESNFEYIVDSTFTANMEADLDKIADGNKTKLEVLSVFWKYFSKTLTKFDQHKTTKISLQNENKEIRINDQLYTIRTAKYGPVVEYVESDTKKYINLKSYLKIMKKQLMDIDEKDVILLKDLPYSIGNYNNNLVSLCLGPYGFYLKYDQKNIKINYEKVQKFIRTGKLLIEDIENIITYYLSPEGEKSRADYKKKISKK